MSGWQLEQKWEQEQQKKKADQEKQMEKFMGGGGTGTSNDDDNEVAVDDGLPFACYICRDAFDEPIVTTCSHYFCQSCLHTHNQQNNNKCPVCNAETHGVMNQPTKLITKKRKLLGRNATWQEFMDSQKKS